MFLSGPENSSTSAANLHGLIDEVENATWRTDMSSFSLKIWLNCWKRGLKDGFVPSNMWHMCINQKRFLYIGLFWAKPSLIFRTGVSYLENQIHLWALIFGSQNFPVWHMFLKYRSLENENEFQKNKRFFFSKQTNIKKPISIYT